MTVRRFRRRDCLKQHKYVAFQVGGPFDPLPSWFQELVRKGQAKVMDTSVAVLTVTGNWREVAQGGWIAYRQDQTLWEMNNEDFNQLFYEVD